MTKQESFKKRVRARMAATGERYAAARRVLVAKASSGQSRVWVSEPEMGEEAVTAGTGRGWDEWCDLIDGWPGRTEGHAAIAAHLHRDHGVDQWWAQTVTVGYERITGLRLPHQRADGTFTAGKSRTVAVDGDELRRLLLDDDHRADLLGGVDAELRSKPTSKSIRLAIDPGIAVVDLSPAGDGRTKVTVAHERLPLFDQVAEWKFFWSEWLDALDDA